MDNILDHITIGKALIRDFCDKHDWQGVIQTAEDMVTASGAEPVNVNRTYAAKFVQICAVGSGLVALDEDGVVWERGSFGGGIWERAVMERVETR